jgi:hypothetical protein
MGSEIMPLLLAWIVQLGLVAGILFAASKLSDMQKQMAKMHEEVRLVRDRLESMSPGK